MSIVLYLGSPSAIHEHWRKRLTTLDAPERQASRVLVPTKRLAEALNGRVSEAPDIMAIDQWLELVLPQHIMRSPHGTWEILSELAPPALVPEPWKSTPGIAMSLARIIQAGRREGLSHMVSSRTDRIPWADLWSWYADRFSGGVSDELRLYEYAGVTAKVPNAPGGATFLYGFGRISSPLAALLRHWGTRTTVEAWAITGSVEPEIVRGLKGRGATIVELESGAGGRWVGIPIPAGSDPVDEVAQLIRDENLPWPETVVCIDSDEPRPLVRALARQRLISPETVERTDSDSLWPLFLSVAGGQARAAVRRRWAEWLSTHRLPGRDFDAWARHWWKRVRDVSRWSQLGPLMEEAAQYHGLSEAWQFAMTWGQQAWVFDEWGSNPTPERVRLIMTTLAPNEAMNPLPILPLHEAVWLPSWNLVLAGQGRFPRPVPRTPWDGEAAVRPWIRQSYPESQDAVILRALAQDSGMMRWIALPSPDDRRFPLDEIRTVEPRHLEEGPSMADSARIHAWYRGWRESAEYSAFTGQVDAELVRALSPARLSPSALEDFGRCPLSYFLRRLLRVQEPEEEMVEVDVRLQGQWAHRALQWMVEQKFPLNPGNVRDAVQAAIAENPAPDTVAPFHIRYQAEKLTSELYEALLRDDWTPDLRSAVEVDIAWESFWPMQGRVDRMDWLPDGTIRLVDYKTGQITNPARVSPPHLQLLLYQGAVSAQYGKPVAAELFGISQRSGYQHRAVNPEQAQEVRPELERILQGIKERMDAGAFYPVPDPRVQPCRMCSYREVCPSGVVRYAEAKIAENPAYQSLWNSDGEGGGTDAAD